MRLLLLALIAASLGAEEAKIQVAGGELRYLYSAGGAPLLVVLPGGMEEQPVRKLFSRWQPLAAARGWSCLTPFVAGVSDQAVKAIEIILADAAKRLPQVDMTRVYLAG